MMAVIKTRAKRVLTCGLKWGGVSLLLLLGLLFVLLFSSAGLRLVLWGAQQSLPQLQVARSEGVLLRDFSLYGVRFHDPESALDLSLEQFSIALDGSCLLRQELCVSALLLDGLTLSLPQQAAEDNSVEPSPAPAATVPQLPWPVHLQNIQLNQVTLAVQDNRLEWQQLTTALQLSGRQLDILPTRLTGLALYPAQSAANSKEAASTAGATAAPVSLPSVQLPLAVNLQQLELQDITLHGDTPLQVSRLQLSAEAAEQDITLHRLALQMPQAALQLAARLKLEGDYPLTLQAEAELHQAPLQGQKASLKATGSLRELQLDARLSERVQAVLTGQLQPLDAELPFAFELSQARLPWPLSGQPQYHAAIDALQASGNLKGYRVALQGKVSGDAIPATALTLQGQGDTQQIALQQIKLATLGGEINGELSSRWQPALSWQASLALDNLQPGKFWPQAEGKLGGTLQTSGAVQPSGEWQVALPALDLLGEIRGYPLTLRGQARAGGSSEEGSLTLMSQGLTLSHGPNRVLFSGQVDKEVRMDVLVQLDDLAKSLPQFAGSVAGQLQARGSLQQPLLTTELKAEGLAVSDVARLKSLALNAELSPLPEPRGTLSLTVNDMQAQGQRFDALTLQLSGSQAAHQLEFYLRSALVNAGLSVDGGLLSSVAGTAQKWQGALTRGSVTTDQGRWLLQQPVALSYLLEKQQADIAAHCWTQAAASLCLPEAARVGRAGNLSLTLNSFSFAQLARYLPPDTQVKGTVNASSEVSWSAGGEPQASLSLNLPPGQVTRQLDQPLTLGWQKAQLNARLKNNRLESDWLLDLSKNGEMNGWLTVANVQAGEPQLTGEIHAAQLNLDPLATLLNEYSQLAALFQADLAVSGPLRQPMLKGELRAEQIQLLGQVTPLEITGGEASVRFSGYQARLAAELQSSDGPLNLEGEADWHDLAAWSSNLHLYAGELAVNLPPRLRFRLKPDMTLHLTPTLARVEGDIYLPWGRIEVEELPESAVAVSSDQVLLDEQLQPVKVSQPLPMQLESDVTIHLGPDFRLQAFGLRAALNGQLKVSQKDQQPFIFGEVNIADGSYRSFGQDLLIRQGLVLMNGPANQPYLQMEAVRNPDNTEDDVIAGLKVTGPASQPVIELFSEPAMPQQNALSYLLRGQDIDGEGSDNAMTTALIGLSLAKSGRLVGELGEALGVSDLRLDTAGSGDSSQVTVSGYILPGLKVKYGVGIFDSVGEFTVRYRLLQDLYLQAVSGVTSAVDLLYQFEFD